MVALSKRLWSEGVGTAWLVFVGCASTVLDTTSVLQASGALQMSLAFGLALTTASYAFGKISGAHFNPAVTIGLTVAQRFPVRDLLPYIAAQIAGAIVGAAFLAYLACGRPGFELAASEFAANGFGAHSPADYPLHSALVMEFVLSFVFVAACLLVVVREELATAAPFITGACLMLVYLVSIPVTNGSVNPARSTAQALFVGNWALDQLWLFWAAPLAGAIAAGVLFSFFDGHADASTASPADGQGDVS
ncbi:aquaporin Z [Paraburkholderia sp. MMS20-SJTN17]|uniref:Aquaporin Z n=1 Tax=Paraburkholderia translucens TaxID=2886945 RepID=A0ABS8KHF6_9BURK|nr:aquaporin Z [Paraburkholderia sp. MMS20-SJTN17]MCC8404201.1 aquaporin Z [Paraburkholderia sp. MMS20-SJTN17]